MSGGSAGGGKDTSGRRGRGGAATSRACRTSRAGMATEEAGAGLRWTRCWVCSAATAAAPLRDFGPRFLQQKQTDRGGRPAKKPFQIEVTPPRLFAVGFCRLHQAARVGSPLEVSSRSPHPLPRWKLTSLISTLLLADQDGKTV
ncbi:unnamed protein product [Urochloa humidicola]